MYSGGMAGPRAKKSLGQNFLTSPSVAKDIVNAAELRPGEVVVEIGPGKGALTNHLLAQDTRVIAIEKDERLIPILSQRFAREISAGRLSLVPGDIAQMQTWQNVVRKHRLAEGGFAVVANIPYYITGMLFRLFLESGPQPRTLVFLVQKEVAQNAVARRGKESILSLSLRAYGTPKLIRIVGRKFFSPQPKVDSAVLAVKNISRARFPTRASERRFFEVIHAGFSAKRKILANNLVRGLGREKRDVERLLASLSLPLSVRAEDVGIDDWIRISSLL